MIRRPPSSTLLPNTTPFRSGRRRRNRRCQDREPRRRPAPPRGYPARLTFHVKHWSDGDHSPWRSTLTTTDAGLLEQTYTEAIQLGFLGPREQERLWERHLDDALGLAAIRRPEPGERWADLGSGAGLPGLPLAVAHRATSFTLIDAHRRRLDWIVATAARLHLTNEIGRASCRERV